MEAVYDVQEEGSSLYNETSQAGSRVEKDQRDEKSLQERTLKVLIHLRDNRIFYFILACSLFVLAIMLQVRAAYRSYDDDQRLVKLWTQEKQLKDMMAHKNPPIDSPVLSPTLTAPATSVSHNTTHPRPSKSPSDTSTKPQEKSLFKYGSNKRTVVTAGISKAQLLVQKKWLELKDQNIFTETALSQEERKYYQQKYGISKYEQLPFCVVIPTYNNAEKDRHIKNIKSVVMQQYSNYHIVFIDDASDDKTSEDVSKFMANQTKVPPSRFIMIKNEKQLRAMPNLRRAAKEFCKPFEIFLVVDGDDELLGRQVLKLYNAIFQKEGAWFVYSNFLSVRGNIGYSRPFPSKVIAANSYRKYPFVTSHLRAFYTQLFLNIKEEDLQDSKGNYLRAANDVAICLPILEMSHQKVTYLREITYFYNSNTGQNNHQLRLKEQKANDAMIRKKKPYQPLASLVPNATDLQ